MYMVYLLLRFCSQVSPPMCAASNNHSPNKCRMLLHFGRATDNVGRSSAPIEGNAIYRERERGNGNVGNSESVSN